MELRATQKKIFSTKNYDSPGLSKAYKMTDNIIQDRDRSPENIYNQRVTKPLQEPMFPMKKSSSQSRDMSNRVAGDGKQAMSNKYLIEDTEPFGGSSSTKRMKRNTTGKNLFSSNIQIGYTGYTG